MSPFDSLHIRSTTTEIQSSNLCRSLRRVQKIYYQSNEYADELDDIGVSDGKQSAS